MNKDVLVRRSVHCLIALAPLYFLLPDDLPIHPLRRWALLIAFLVAIGVFDAWRRRKGLTFLGLRPHESEGIASYAWAAAGITFVLWLTPDQDIATAALVGMAFVDPLAGELRVKFGKASWTIVTSIIAYSALAFSVMALWGDHTILQSAIIAVIGAGVAIPSEIVKIRYVDDDFTMLVFPALAMSWVALVF